MKYANMLLSQTEWAYSL